MRPIPIAGTLVLGLALLAACADTNPLSPALDHGLLFSQVPADGNGNTQVFVIDINDEVSCGNQTLARNVGGWIQVRLFDQAGNRNVEQDVFHLLITFTNSSGESFVWSQVGPDRYWVEDGNLMVAITGHGGPGGHIGTLRVNLTTDEVVFSAGPDFGRARDQACAALT